MAVLCEELGLGKQMSSLISYVSQVPPFKLDENANVCDQTRKELAIQEAFVKVQKGIGLIKIGNTIEALAILNEAVTLDPDNVQGLVTRGRL